jgi:hypothetical protein
LFHNFPSSNESYTIFLNLQKFKYIQKIENLIRLPLGRNCTQSICTVVRGPRPQRAWPKACRAGLGLRDRRRCYSGGGGANDGARAPMAERLQYWWKMIKPIRISFISSWKTNRFDLEFFKFWFFWKIKNQKKRMINPKNWAINQKYRSVYYFPFKFSILNKKSIKNWSTNRKNWIKTDR